MWWWSGAHIDNSDLGWVVPGNAALQEQRYVTISSFRRRAERATGADASAVDGARMHRAPACCQAGPISSTAERDTVGTR
jgi:hypothetical protein